MSLDSVGWYLLRYNRPGSANSVAGIAIDYAFQVGRRSLFGYALSRLLTPTERESTHAFRRQFTLLVTLPRRYQEAIVEHNRAHPQSPFVAQGGPTYTVHRARLEHPANISTQDVLNALLDNRIPPEWVDHSYAYAVGVLNAHFTGSPINRGLLDPVDNERIARVRRYGIPRSMTNWDGWRHPSFEEVQTIHDIMSAEDERTPERERNNAPDHRRGFESPAWLLVGQNGMVEFLTHRPRAEVERYARDHPIALPSYSELGDPLVAAPPSGGNPLGEMATVDVVMDANADNPQPLEAIASGLGDPPLAHLEVPSTVGDTADDTPMEPAGQLEEPSTTGSAPST